MKMYRWLLLLLMVVISTPALASDPGYADWTALLQANVTEVDHGHTSRVNYAAIKHHDGQLDAISDGWHGITSVKQFFAMHAVDLTADKTAQARIHAQKVAVDYGDYN